MTNSTISLVPAGTPDQCSTGELLEPPQVYWRAIVPVDPTRWVIPAPDREMSATVSLACWAGVSLGAGLLFAEGNTKCACDLCRALVWSAADDGAPCELAVPWPLLAGLLDGGRAACVVLLLPVAGALAVADLAVVGCVLEPHAVTASIDPASIANPAPIFATHK